MAAELRRYDSSRMKVEWIVEVVRFQFCDMVGHASRSVCSEVVSASTINRAALGGVGRFRHQALLRAAHLRHSAQLAWLIVVDELEWFLVGAASRSLGSVWAREILRVSSSNRASHNSLRFARDSVLLLTL